MNKPLTKERRAELEAAAHMNQGLTTAEGMELLAAEQYWREAVRDAPEIGEEMGDCQWGCDTIGRNHRDDCAWKRAQEGE